MKKIILMATLFVSATSAFAASNSRYKDITVSCQVSSGKDMTGQKFDIKNPYGGGEQVKATLPDGSTLILTISIAQNEDDKNLIDMDLMVENKYVKGFMRALARGLSENKYKENGVHADVFYGNSLMDSVRVGCKI